LAGGKIKSNPRAQAEACATWAADLKIGHYIFGTGRRSEVRAVQFGARTRERAGRAQPLQLTSMVADLFFLLRTTFFERVDERVVAVHSGVNSEFSGIANRVQMKLREAAHKCHCTGESPKSRN
jgi:hypothetical protein